MEDRLKIESLAPLIRKEILSSRHAQSPLKSPSLEANADSLRSKLLRLEETNENFGNVEFVKQIRKLIASVVETGVRFRDVKYLFWLMFINAD